MDAQKPNLVQESRPKRSGFALIVVLFSLSVITLLLTMSQGQMLRNVETLAAQQVIAGKPNQVRSILQAHVLRFDPRQPQGSVSFGGGTYDINLQNVGGLIDVNSAPTELVELMVRSLELADTEAALSKIMGRRQINAPFQSLSEVASDIGVDAAQLIDIATVYSGRPGLDPRHVSDAVEELLSGGVLGELQTRAPQGRYHLAGAGIMVVGRLDIAN